MPPARILFYVATFGALALVARSLLIRPVPTWVTLAALAAYTAIVLSGVLVLRLRMFVDAVCRGPDDARGVALTFDDGPNPTHTPKVLDLLDRAKLKATFFVIGKKAEAHPEIVRDIVARGHTLGSHGYAHPRTFAMLPTSAVRADIERSLVVLEKITGRKPTLFRPPIGHTNPRIAKVVTELDLTVIGWSVRAIDGLASADETKVAARVVRGLEDGAIVLLHDAAERDDHVPASLGALPAILEGVRARNLDGVAVMDFVEGSREEGAA
ncbi:polysaccharide deacetylase family protein [Polyangium sp. 15x6]|uniref:polysaccharide deacetylase family protein n=1 Tax=Polyangium sp. 15x6 TaxID=3042687 RepID=UPI00249A84B3|nr:polysaccharide deacetylase family protein [Polyangium sp. 15x6]MDI3284893.1 polysaccharide deacetylase family protein [Polyangium sp. 15x6]